MAWTAEQAMNAGHAKQDPVTREEIAESLAHAVFAARRTFRVVGSPEHPTAWDKISSYIDYLLYKYQQADE